MNSDTRLKNLLEEARAVHARLGDALGLDHTCIRCMHWSQGVEHGGPSNPDEMCHKFYQRPPARIIAQGCPEFVEDIPF